MIAVNANAGGRQLPVPPSTGVEAQPWLHQQENAVLEFGQRCFARGLIQRNQQRTELFCAWIHRPPIGTGRAVPCVEHWRETILPASSRAVSSVTDSGSEDEHGAPAGGER